MGQKTHMCRGKTRQKTHVRMKTRAMATTTRAIARNRRARRRKRRLPRRQKEKAMSTRRR